MTFEDWKDAMILVGAIFLFLAVAILLVPWIGEAAIRYWAWVHTVMSR